MTVSRDADFPDEIAQLFQAMSKCAEGHAPFNVMEATANLLVASILFYARSNNLGLPDALSLASRLGEGLPGNVAEQWDREAKPTDVVVIDASN